jgi:hypothetical protein
MKAFACAIFASLALAVCIAWAAPEPALVPQPGQWTVDTKFTHPLQITLKSSPAGKTVRFWYTLLTVTNNTGKEVGFYPKCELVTDTFQVLPAGKSVSASVFGHIEKRHKSMYPFLGPLEKVSSKLLQGEDNTQDIAVIWPDFDLKAKSIKIFITGLSNETAVVNHPVARDENGKPLMIFLRKTLELTYALQGDPATRTSQDLVYTSKRWVMR